MRRFSRRPCASTGVDEIEVRTRDVVLSGLVARPRSEPRGLIVAIHGAGMHAGYYDATSAPGLSLLTLGASLGFTVWAPDRPGIGVSAYLPDAQIGLLPQASTLLDAIDAFASEGPVGAGVFLVAHSYGMKVALAMAAEPRGAQLLGLDGAGSGIRYAFEWGADEPARAPGDRGPAWGPEVLYPPGTFDASRLPVHPMPAAQSAEGGAWPDELRRFGDCVRIPVRFTFAAHERFWPTDDRHLGELRSVLPNAPEVSFAIEPDAGHNLSLGWAARSYHLAALAFAERCIRRRRAR